MTQWNLFMAFIRVSLLGYGGGPAAIPLLYKEVVDRYKWLTDDEFSDILALANTLPGPIATKMAGYIGRRVGGTVGLMNAVLATIVPTIILLIVLLSVLGSLSDEPWVQGMTAAVVPVVGVLLLVLTWQFIKKAKGTLGLLVTALLSFASLLIIEWLGIHPGIVIALLLGAALLRRDDPKKGAGTQ
ncbi:chromate transporter [Pontibacillus halophilus JSM 076056 = DSM 19796]|uniref:Chromate transporter n=1 Tax=Pontibacillus halophilus JSM 076056 = DSM 19796 TaxID=1385510 RepID=A0A0A5GN28_9BACI|nr:chromate transporter [Pontibacillus halophilus]KGX92540.1 chromate transporter [Pontibacillus halophilus JSM 076056 = DSM 19796]